MSSIIEIKDLAKWYVQKKQIVKAVDGVSFYLERGEVLGIIGESGCGKSTLARLLVCLEKATKGVINFDGEPIDIRLKNDLLQFRRDCQMIFQNPYDTFDPRHNVRKILTSALKIHRIGGSEEERIRISIEYLEKAGIKPAEGYLDRYPHELSGGQLQRISIIRSCMLNPKLIIADEPVSMLDISVRADIINLLLDLIMENNAGLILISHDIPTTGYISDRIAVMYLGKIVEIGPTDAIIKNPKHPYTKALISNCMSIDPYEKANRIKITGEPPMPVNIGMGCYFGPRCYKANDKCLNSYPDMEKVGDQHYASCFYLFDEGL